MLAPIIVMVSPFHAYMQKQKPQPIGQPDIETLAMRLEADPAECDALVRDDVMPDQISNRHPARRLDVVVRGKALLPGTEYATRPDDSAEGRIKPAEKPKKRKRKTTAADLGAPTLPR